MPPLAIRAALATLVALALLPTCHLRRALAAEDLPLFGEALGLPSRPPASAETPVDEA